MCKVVRMVCSILKRTLSLIAYGESVSNARNILSRVSAALEHSRHGSAVLGRVCGILRRVHTTLVPPHKLNRTPHRRVLAVLMRTCDILKSKSRCRTLMNVRTQRNVTL